MNPFYAIQITSGICFIIETTSKYALGKGWLIWWAMWFVIITTINIIIELKETFKKKSS